MKTCLKQVTLQRGSRILSVTRHFDRKRDTCPWLHDDVSSPAGSPAAAGPGSVGWSALVPERRGQGAGGVASGEGGGVASWAGGRGLRSSVSDHGGGHEPFPSR